MDFLQDALASGRKVRTLSIEDAFTREMLAIEVDTSLPALRVVRVLDRLRQLLRHVTPLTRRDVVYFYSGAHTWSVMATNIRIADVDRQFTDNTLLWAAKHGGATAMASNQLL